MLERVSRRAVLAAAVVAVLLPLTLVVLRPWDSTPRARHLLPADDQVLQLTLESLPSGVPRLVTEGELRYELQPTGTLRTADGVVCREFDSAVMRGESRERGHGLACREGAGGWQLRALEPLLQDAATGGPLAALGPGERLTYDQEQALLAQGWSVKP